MIKKYLPNSILSCVEYAKRCDHYFMRAEAKNYQFTQKTFSYDKIKNGDFIWCHSMQLVDLFNYIETTNLEDLTLISGDDDHLTDPNGTSSLVKFLPKHFKKWYSQNANVVNTTMIPIPIGLCPPWAMGVSNSQELSNMLDDYERNKLLFVHFCIGTNPSKRSQVFDIVTNNMKTMCTIQNNFITQKDQMFKYYKELQEHKYVLCPPGNGMDTHRLWESLYCGAIPIVENTASNLYFAKMFPILVVDRWSDITPDYLEKNMDRFINNEWQYDLLDCDNLFNEYSLRNNK